MKHELENPVPVDNKNLGKKLLIANSLVIGLTITTISQGWSGKEMLPWYILASTLIITSRMLGLRQINKANEIAGKYDVGTRSSEELIEYKGSKIPSLRGAFIDSDALACGTAFPPIAPLIVIGYALEAAANTIRANEAKQRTKIEPK